MSAFEDNVKKNVKCTTSKPPRVSARTSYTDKDLETAGSVETLCDQSSAVCLVVCNYAVSSIGSKPVTENGKTYIWSDSVDPTSIEKPPKLPPTI